MKQFLLFLIAVNLFCSTFKSRTHEKEKNKCSEKTLSLLIGYSQDLDFVSRGDTGLVDREGGVAVISKKSQFYGIKKKLEDSCLFKKIEFNGTDSDFTMELVIAYKSGVNGYLYLGTLASIFATGFWIIPYNSDYELNINVTLIDSKIKSQWKKTQNEKITTWWHPILIFTFPFYGFERAEDILTDNIVNSIIKDLSGKDFLYK